MHFFPTPDHKKATAAVVNFCNQFHNISAILLTCSCARGKASPESCVDITILLRPEVYDEIAKEILNIWDDFYQHETAIQKMLAHGKFAHIDLDLSNGVFNPDNYYHGWMSGPDTFELEVGNQIKYSIPLQANDKYYEELRSKWLPYYPNDLAEQRLDMVMKYCINNLDHIESCVNRKLFFQAFDRFYNACREFLQALFISSRKYPICYEKWIKEQIVDILELPDLYSEILQLYAIPALDSNKMLENREKLLSLIKLYIYYI
ncbi:MAG: hypothetical protein JXB60_06630 [Candidatus Cloacimonetes bacterium]|nr:hypothetical protein [Candidatus Cloacimonadota bacterium]